MAEDDDDDDDYYSFLQRFAEIYTSCFCRLAIFESVEETACVSIQLLPGGRKRSFVRYPNAHSVFGFHFVEQSFARKGMHLNLI